MSTKFHNPYSPRLIGDSTPTKTIMAHIGVADYNLIKCTRPGSATISGTLGTLVFKLCHALRNAEILDASKQVEFEDFVANCKIISNHEYEQLTTRNGTGGGLSDGTPKKRKGS